MKKILVLLLSCVICGSIIFTGCSKTGQETTDGGSNASDTQKYIEEEIIGSWMPVEHDGKPTLTNEKGLFTFVSPKKAYISVSFDARPKLGKQWSNQSEADVAITDNKVTLTRLLDKDTTLVSEVTISDITDTETHGDLVLKTVKDGKDTTVSEGKIFLKKTSEDYSRDILGTWEGRCTSKGSEFDDGQKHRWEYKDDGSYVYYVKDGDNWVPGDDTTNEYFVAGNLLCTRWMEGTKEFREWWDISIDGDKMNWTALRKDKAGKTFTVEFEMTRVEE